MSEVKNKKLNVMLNSALLMAVSTAGPGFITQTVSFTAEYGTALTPVILCVICMDIVVQVNVWSVVGVSGLRAQDIANRLLPGLGYVLAFMVAVGGLVFNIGNIGGISLGLNALLGLPVRWGCLLGGFLAVCIFLSKQASAGLDRAAQLFGAVIILIGLAVAVSSQPPVKQAAGSILAPEDPSAFTLPLITLLGGSCGGYISFTGAHRLLDAGLRSRADLRYIRGGALLGTSVSGLIRILMFLAVLGVCASHPGAGELIAGSENPAADTFRLALGSAGYRLFGLMLFCAGAASVVGATYTSVSFLKTLHPMIERHERQLVVCFIAVSTLIMVINGGASQLLLAAGAVNGLILPLSLFTILAASGKGSVVGDGYRHNRLLLLLGLMIACVTLFSGLKSLPNLFLLFHS